MKKIISIILLALLLASCGVAKPPVEPKFPTPVPTAVQTVEPTATPVPTPEDTGFSLNEIYERWYPETVHEVRPRTDYGELLPFVGGVVASMYYDDGALYGFTTRDGKIVCDATFDDVTEYEFGGERVYLARRATGKTDGVYPPPYEIHVIASDGSAARVVDEATDAGGGYVSYLTGGKWGVCGFDGRDVIAPEYAWPLYYGDGVFVAAAEFGGAVEFAYVYLDASGSIVLGPYELFLPKWLESALHEEQNYYVYDIAYIVKSYAFSDGRAPRAVSYEVVDEYGTMNMLYGYIDKAGDFVLPAKYETRDTPSVFSDGRAVIHNEYEDYSDGYELIDTEGRVILPEGNFIWSSYELYARSVGAGAVYYDRDGNEVFRGGGYSAHLGDGWFADQTVYWGELSLIKDGKTYLEFPAEYRDSSMYMERIGDDRFWFQAYYQDYDKPEGGGQSPAKIIDSAGKVYFEFGDDGLQYYGATAGGLINLAQYGERGVRRGLYDADGNVVIPPEFGILEERGEFFAARRGYYGGLVDARGEWVVKVSLLDYLDD